MSRPRGAKRTALGGFVSNGGEFTMRELAGKLGCTIKQASWLIARAKDSGELTEAGTKRVDGAKRPVAVFRGASVCTDATAAPDLATAIQGWGR